MTSDELSKGNDPLMKQNGGKMKECISHDYEKDFVLEAVLQDKLRQDKKSV